MIDFEWYRSFIAVYRTGTVTAAAKYRYLTQPAISQHISALESSVGYELFERTPRKMVPTEQGKMLYSRMVPAMDSLEKVSASLRDSTTEGIPIVRLGTPLDYFYEVGFEKVKNAQIRMQVELGETAAMIASLLDGRLDIVIATQQIESTNLDYTKLEEEHFCLVSPPAVRLPKNLEKSSDQIKELEQFLLQQPWISYSEELPIIRRFWHVTFEKRPNIEPVMVAPSLRLIRKAVESGLGISILPRYMCEGPSQTGKLNILWQPKKPISNELWIATRKVDRNMPEIERTIALMKNN